LNAKRYIEFVKIIMSRFNSEEDYRRFQQFQARWLLEEFNEWGIDLRDDIVLDVGSGLGGYSVEMMNCAKMVCAVDIMPVKVAGDKENYFFVNGDALNLPFNNNSFDFVFCSSLLEHIPNKKRARLLEEVRRVLKPGGYCYLSFPPFYTLVGGHGFKPFHLLGERTALILSRCLKTIDAKSFDEYGLYRTTIHGIKKMIEGKFEITTQKTRFSPINVSRIPLLNEFLTWHVEFVLCKVEAVADRSRKQLAKATAPGIENVSSGFVDMIGHSSLGAEVVAVPDFIYERMPTRPV